MNSIQKRELLGNLRGAMVSGIITAIFMYWVYYRGMISVWAGLFIGFWIYIAMTTYIDKIARRYLLKTNLFLTLLINTIFNLLIMLIIAWVGVGLIYMKGNFKYMIENIENVVGFYYQIGLLFGLLLSISFNFFAMINTLIGKNVLGKLFIGRYRTPFEVERVFMFLDIKSSTSIAEKIGHKNFLSLVNDFFYDIVGPVYQTKGEIYKYVGDEAIISWKTKHAVKHSNALYCFFLIKDVIDRRKNYYENKYGVVPQFKAGMHGGTAITGELGYTKREIAYMGDVINTTARIEEACKTYHSDFLVSAYLHQNIKSDKLFNFSEVGNVKLRGKESEVKLFEVSRN